ncbi:MAG: glycosyltransferase family 4 protein [bacterium]
MGKSTIKILLIGPLPPPVHGTTVSFRQMVKQLQIQNLVEIQIIDTSRKYSNFNLLDTIKVALRTIMKLILYTKKVDIVTYHASPKAALLFSPVVHIVSRCFRKPWVLRCFGGNIDQVYKAFSPVIRFFIQKTSLAADSCLFQTHHLVDFFNKICKTHALWFPNNRLMPPLTTATSRTTAINKFIFVGNVKYSKGIKEIIEASGKFKSKIIVDVYGPFQEGIDEQNFKGLTVVKYKGVLSPDQVIATIKKYHILLLPSYYQGEGYPGVILEAYAAGIPVITTDWRSISEIVDETSGILIQPKNANELFLAMKRTISNRKVYQKLKLGVKMKRNIFSVEKWTAVFLKRCQMLVYRKKSG